MSMIRRKKEAHDKLIMTIIVTIQFLEEKIN